MDVLQEELVIECPERSTNRINILIIDDEMNFTEEMEEFLKISGYEAFSAHTASRGMEILNSREIDLLILDVRLPGCNGLDLITDVKTKNPNIEIIVISAHGGMDTVIKAMRLGAIDYLRKPFRHIDIKIAIQRTQKFIQLQRQIKLIEEKNSLISKNLQDRIERKFIGESPEIKEVLDLAITASKYPDTNVLITGESGTGKENVARIIHYASEKKDNVFCAVNSSAITDSLLESEFFGHKRGSFTGAITDKKGFFEVCNNATLFLDEIADMPFNLQAKILRAIEEKKITPVGDTKQISTDFRIISATNHDVEKLVENNKFRLDLLHRLNTLHIQIPPLRERPSDIGPLFNHFVEAFSVKLNKAKPKVEKDVVKALKKYDFPGNVRELKNMTERAMILCKGNILTMQDFPFKSENKSAIQEASQQLDLKDNEVKLIRLALRKNDFNQKLTADTLGITRDSLIRRMKKYNIQIKKME